MPFRLTRDGVDRVHLCVRSPVIWFIHACVRWTWMRVYRVCTSWLPTAVKFEDRIDVLTYLYSIFLLLVNTLHRPHIHIDRVYTYVSLCCVFSSIFIVCAVRPASSSPSSAEAIVLSLLGKQLCIVCIAHEHFCLLRRFPQFDNCRRFRFIKLYSVDRLLPSTREPCQWHYVNHSKRNIDAVSRVYRSNHHCINSIRVKYTHTHSIRGHDD